MILPICSHMLTGLNLAVFVAVSPTVLPGPIWPRILILVFSDCQDLRLLLLVAYYMMAVERFDNCHPTKETHGPFVSRGRSWKLRCKTMHVVNKIGRKKGKYQSVTFSPLLSITNRSIFSQTFLSLFLWKNTSNVCVFR